MQRKNRHLPVAFTAVELKDRLWAPRQRAVRERTVPFLYGQMEKIGTIEALDVTKPPGPLAFPYRKNNTSTSVMYWDSDIAKWIETASYTLATHPDPALDALIDEVVARIARAQEPDGYFNSFFQRREPAKKWSNLRDWHELYCVGHMIEAAVAHNQATGKTQPARHRVPPGRPRRRNCSGRTRARSAATAATRRSSWRWSSSTG